MEAVFLTLLEVSAATAVVIVAVVLLSSLINRSFTAKWKYWLWMVLAARLLVPFNPSFEAAPARVEVNIPAATITLPAAAVAQPAQPAAPPATPGQIILPDTPSPSTPAAPSTPAVPNVSTSPSVSAAPVITVMELLMLVWLLGVILFLLWQGVNYLRFSRQVRRWGLPIKRNSPVAAVRRQVKEELGIRRKIPALVCQRVTSPMMIGFFRPLLILPREDYREEDLSFILRHELTHYQRRDIWYKALLLLANAVHWFNPAVWLMAREACRDLEISCDAAVMKDAGMEERRTYSEIILSCVHRELKMKTALSTHFYGGKKALKERFANILSTKKRRTGLAAFAAVVLCGGLIGGLVACGTDKRDLPEDWARVALSVLFSVSTEEAEEFYAIDPVPPAGQDSGIAPAPEGIGEFFDHLWGHVMTEDCIQNLIADRVFTRIADFVLENEREVRFVGLSYSARDDAENLYDYTVRMAFMNYDPDTQEFFIGRTVAEPTGTIQMEPDSESGGWKASHITVNLTFDGGAQDSQWNDHFSGVVAKGTDDSQVAPDQSRIPTRTDWAGQDQVEQYQKLLDDLDPMAVTDFALFIAPSDEAKTIALRGGEGQLESVLLRLKSVRLSATQPMNPETGGSVTLHIVTDDDQLTIRHVGNLLYIGRRDQDTMWTFDGEGCADIFQTMRVTAETLLTDGPNTPSQSGGSDENSLHFGLGPEGAVQAMRSGDTIGSWQLQSYYATWDETYDQGVRVDEAVFTAGTPVELRCRVTMSPYAVDDGKRYYYFQVDEGDYNQLPVMEGDPRVLWFDGSQDNPALSALADLGDNDRWNCRVWIDRYTYRYVPMAVGNGANIVRLERIPDDPNIQTAIFEVDYAGINGEAYDGGFQLYVDMPVSWTTSGNAIYDEEGLLTAELLPAIYYYSEEGSAFDILGGRYPDAEPIDVTIGNLTGKRYTRSTTETDGPFAGAINNEIFYYLRWNDFYFTLKFYPKRGIGIGTQAEEFQSRISIVR